MIYHYFPSAASENSRYQLFNLADDPFEQKNLAATQPAELGRLMQGLVDGLERQQALYPLEKGGTAPVKPKLP